MSTPFITTLLWGAIFAGLAFSAFSDLKDRIIPDELAILIVVSGLALRLTLQPSEVWSSLAAGAAVFFVLSIFCHYGLIGGGDVKMTAAVTLLVTHDRIGSFLFDVALAGGLLSLFYLGAKSVIERSVIGSRLSMPATGQSWFQIERERIASGKSVPYALAIFGGFLYHLLTMSS